MATKTTATVQSIQEFMAENLKEGTNQTGKIKFLWSVGYREPAKVTKMLGARYSRVHQVFHTLELAEAEEAGTVEELIQECKSGECMMSTSDISDCTCRCMGRFHGIAIESITSAMPEQ